jgi:hypothetical protein
MKSKISRLVYERYRNSVPQLPNYHRDADFNDIRTGLLLPWLALDIGVPWQKILDEIMRIKSWLVPHRDQYAENQGWNSFCIHGKSADATQEDSHYQDDRPYVWTDEAQQNMPFTVDYFCNHWPGKEYRRIRVMELAPGGYISLHRDSKHTGMCPINICITQPSQCAFVFERHGPVPFQPGMSFWLDVSNRHTVFNDSDQPRYHVIVHQDLAHTAFEKMVVDSYHKMYHAQKVIT